jgi:CheY-like chemotaxis protein
VGLDIARDRQPLAVLLDMNLPDIDGDEVLRRLRADESTAHIPVVVVSARAFDADIQGMLLAGATAYVTKPMDRHYLMRLIDEYKRDLGERGRCG